MAAHKVLCYGDGLKFGYINQPIYSTVDTRRAGSGTNCSCLNLNFYVIYIYFVFIFMKIYLEKV